MTISRARATVVLLAAQAVAFGVAAALLVIPANGIFLSAYGAEWLPLTYVGIALLGTTVSVVIARSLRRWTLPTVAVAVLVSFAAALLATWSIMVVTGSPWPSVVQLMMFPVLLQLGFIIIGGQAGRLLDLQQIKRYFPRIVAGFVVGFMVGGFAAVPLLTWLGAPEDLVVVSAASCVVFTVLVGVTARRRPAELTVVDQQAEDHAARSMRALFATRLVVLVFVYQVLSAMGSQVLDFLVFDRAAARYDDAAELTRFVAVYTGVLNAVDIVFLAVLAGWLLVRFGLRLGLVANPAVVTLLTIGMLVATLGPGASSLILFLIVISARIVDLALSDGLTRGSINAIFQLLPVEQRMAVQASVEGVGVPMAIGATGVVLMVMNALDLGTSWIVAFAFVLCAAWTAAAVVAYAEYRRALGQRLRRRGLDVDASRPVAAEEQTAARRLLLTDDVRDIRLGLDLAVTANLSPADLVDLAKHDDRDIRLLALGVLTRRGDDGATAAAVAEVRTLAASDEGGERRAAAVVLADAHPPDRRELLRRLLRDADVTVRTAALNSVGSPDGALVDDVVAGLDDPSTMQAAIGASRRLGLPALSLAADRLLEADPPQPRLLRLVDAVDVTASEASVILMPLVDHPNRAVSIAALASLARHRVSIEAPILDRLLGEDVALAERALVAAGSMTAADAAVLRSLDDLLATVRDRVFAVLAVRYGEERISAARRALASPDAAQRALGVEMLQVSIPRADAVLVDPVVRDDLDRTERLHRLRARAHEPERERAGWLADLALDRERRWRSPWLQAVALHAELVSDPAVAAGHAAAIDTIPQVAPTFADHALAEVVLAVSVRPDGPSAP